jgi:hypothetical protein
MCDSMTNEEREALASELDRVRERVEYEREQVQFYVRRRLTDQLLQHCGTRDQERILEEYEAHRAKRDAAVRALEELVAEAHRCTLDGSALAAFQAAERCLDAK